MKLRMFGVVLALAAFLFIPSVHGAAKKPKVTIAFYVEANPREDTVFRAPIKLSNPSRDAYISRMPDITERDVKSIYPFDAGDGTFGCALKLDNHGRVTLESLSNLKRGQAVVAVFNNRQIADMIVERTITDGILCIPRGLSQEDVVMLRKSFPEMGSDKALKDDPRQVEEPAPFQTR